MNYKRLYDLGLNEELLKEAEDKYSNFYIGRVAFEGKGLYKVITETNTVIAKVLGKLIYSSNGKSDYPAVGDWVVLDRDNDKNGEAVICGILSRKSKFSNCNHDTEPGCQIKKALEQGLLTKERFNNYLKLKKEAEFMEKKLKNSEALNHKKSTNKSNKKFYNEKRTYL